MKWRLRAFLCLGSSRYVGRLPSHDWEPSHNSCSFIFLDWGHLRWSGGNLSLPHRATGQLVGSVTVSGHAGVITNHFSLYIFRNHHSFWPHVSWHWPGLVTEPHIGKLHQEGPEPTEQDRATPLPGSEARMSDDRCVRPTILTSRPLHSSSRQGILIWNGWFLFFPI